MGKSQLEVDKLGSWIWKDNTAREPNLIVFVHGYTGHPEATWVKFPDLVRQVGHGFDTGFDVASFGYETGLLINYQGVKTIAQLLLSFLDDQGHEAKSVFLITHSLGGVVARQLLVDCYHQADARAIFDKLRQVHFIGVPHQGAALAPSVLKLTKRINPLASDLRRDSPVLRETLDAWNQLLRDCEQEEIDAPELFNYVGNRDRVVPLEEIVEKFRDKENVRVIPGGHIEIAKPHDAENTVYRLVCRRIINAAWKPDAVDFRTAAERFAAGTDTEQDLQSLRDAYRAGRLQMTAGQQSVGVGGDMTGSVLITGNQNQVIFRMEDDAYERVERDVIGREPGRPPAAPALFVGRDSDLRTIKTRLGIGAPDGAEEPQVSCIRGWPGVGKTSTAISLARDPETRREFPDGVLWTSLGQEPRVASAMAAWGRSLGTDELLTTATLEDAIGYLRQVLQGRCMLLIVDDVWEIDHALPFRRATPNTCTVLFTTREGQVADQLDPTQKTIFTLPVLDDKAAVALLGELAPDAVRQQPEECLELVQNLECLPLSLHVAGRMLQRERQYDWGVKDLLAKLHDGTELLERKAPEDRFDRQNNTLPTVAVLLEQSTSRLDKRTHDCFAFLGAFAPKPATFDLDAMQAVWRVDADSARANVRELISRGLLEPVGGGRFQMHALLVAYAQNLLSD